MDATEISATKGRISVLFLIQIIPRQGQRFWVIALCEGRGGRCCVASVSEEAVLHAQLLIYFIWLISRSTLNIFLHFFGCTVPEFLRAVFPKCRICFIWFLFFVWMPHPFVTFRRLCQIFAYTFCTFFRRTAEHYFPWHVARTIHTSSHPTSQPRRL